MKLNKTTKKASHFICEYENSYIYSVRDFYKTCSSEKISAENRIKSAMLENGGNDYRILSGNSFNFTCGYKINNILVIETVASIFEIEL
jgi:hypothetical protein